MSGPAIHRFTHPAMATRFEVRIVDADGEYARQAAAAAFAELDRLEGELSRFLPASDVSQINALPAGQAIRVGVATMECLLLAERVRKETGGAFDVTCSGKPHGQANGACPCHPSAWAGQRRLPALPSGDGTNAQCPVPIASAPLELDPQQMAVGVVRAGVTIDLGGIGKGYAIDAMAGLLKEWDIPAALIDGGTSTVLAFGRPPGEAGWHVALRAADDPGKVLDRVRLDGRALSGSAQAGRDHIIDPRTGQAARGSPAAWALAAAAAEADALSTAFVVMDPDEVARYCQDHPDVGAILVSGQGMLSRVGRW